MWASWLEYNKVMNIMKKDFPNLSILKEDDFIIWYGDEGGKSECRIPSSISKRYCTKHNYKFYKNKIDRLVNFQRTPLEIHNYSNRNAPNPQKLILIGTSYSENQIILMSETFKESRKVRSNAVNLPESCKIGYLEDDCFGNYIKNEKPDILIFQIINSGRYIEDNIIRYFFK
jgi:hypothetical protein